MKNQFDGGSAIVEAFRKLGVEYILSSPGTEWAPVWEAMADQIHRRKERSQAAGCVARNARRRHRGGLHAGHRSDAGRVAARGRRPAAGRHGYPRRLCRRGPDGGDLRRVDDLRRAAGVRSGRPVDEQLEHRRRHDQPGRLRSSSTPRSRAAPTRSMKASSAPASWRSGNRPDPLTCPFRRKR